MEQNRQGIYLPTIMRSITRLILKQIQKLMNTEMSGILLLGERVSRWHSASHRTLMVQQHTRELNQRDIGKLSSNSQTQLCTKKMFYRSLITTLMTQTISKTKQTRLRILERLSFAKTRRDLRKRMVKVLKSHSKTKT